MNSCTMIHGPKDGETFNIETRGNVPPALVQFQTGPNRRAVYKIIDSFRLIYQFTNYISTTWDEDPAEEIEGDNPVALLSDRPEDIEATLCQMEDDEAAELRGEPLESQGPDIDSSFPSQIDFEPRDVESPDMDDNDPLPP